jgi:hypothetical protein
MQREINDKENEKSKKYHGKILQAISKQKF